MRCPQCGAETPDNEWNCASCRINLYWASQHYGDLAEIRKQQGLSPSAATPTFLVRVHQNAMDDRAGRAGGEEPRVRQIARLSMQRKTSAGDK